MSGPEEVERLMTILVDGCRTKMMRPKCLARPSWTDDETLSLLNRVKEERIELQKAERLLRMKLDSETSGTVVPMAVRMTPPISLIEDVASECFDVAAFGAMLIDPRRLEKDPTSRRIA